MKTKKSKKNTKFKYGRSNRSDNSEQIYFVQLLDQMFEISSLNYTLYSQSIDDYIQKKKPSLRRRVIYHTITVNAFFSSILNLYLALIVIYNTNSDVTRYICASLSFQLDDQIHLFIYVLFSMMLMLIVVFRMSTFRSESRFKFIIYDLFYDIKVGKYGFEVNKINENNQNFDLFLNLFASSHNAYFLYAYSMVFICYYTYFNLGIHFDILMFIVNFAQFAMSVKAILNTLTLGVAIIHLSPFQHLSNNGNK